MNAEAESRTTHAAPGAPVAPEPRRLALVAWLTFTAAILARIVGPTDLWHQTQPRTISYTVDMLVGGGRSWLLPLDFDAFPATKPPLVNWLAAPFVAVAGRASEFAHKAPSVLALALLVLLLGRVGRHLGPGAGWLAATMTVACYPIFKLGYLARPDMVLILVSLVAWWAATRLLIGDTARPRAWQAVFWSAVVLTALTKGPVAALPVIYAVAAARPLSGRWLGFLRIGIIGAVLALMALIAYYAALWRLDPVFVREVLWYDEVWGRVTGEAVNDRTGSFVRDYLVSPLKIPAYFIARFLPWSIVAVVGAVVALIRIRREGMSARTPLVAAMIWALVVMGAFAFAVGKRADYIAPAYPAAALVAAWWLLRAAPAAWLWRLAPLGAAISVAIMALANELGTEEPAATMRTVERITARLATMADATATPLVIRGGNMLDHLPATSSNRRPAESSVASIAVRLAGTDGLILAYTDETLPAELRDLLDARRRRGEVRELWSEELCWGRDDERRLHHFVVVDVSSRATSDS